MHRDVPSDSQRGAARLEVGLAVFRLLEIVGGASFFGVAAAYALVGADEALRAGIAVSICLPLSAISLALSGKALPRGFNWQFVAIVGGGGLRMGLVLVLAGAFFWFAPVCGRTTFWVWLIAAYLLTLSVEIILLIQLLNRWSEMSRPRPASPGDGQVG